MFAHGAITIIVLNVINEHQTKTLPILSILSSYVTHAINDEDLQNTTIFIEKCIKQAQ